MRRRRKPTRILKSQLAIALMLEDLPGRLTRVQESRGAAAVGLLAVGKMKDGAKSGEQAGHVRGARGRKQISLPERPDVVGQATER